ncbi:hypothetical protein HF984_06115, partial [Rothia terrae]|uniref:P-loop ATPase, Sll1717 family n=2 Tax=Rothia terrae TaxID=396015 RepID=UPI0014474C48
MNKRTFFAYAGQHQLRAETCREVVSSLNKQKIDARHWEDMTVDGKIIIDVIKEEIDKSEYVVAEISDLNFNVLFEVGYSITKNKPVLIAVDDSDDEVKSNIEEFKFLDTIGQSRYQGNNSKLHSLVNEFLYSETNSLYDVFIASAKAREENAVFAPSVPMSYSGPERLQSLLETKTNLNHLVLTDRLEGDLRYYTRNIYRSSACIFHILKESRTGAKIYNAKASLLAGFAVGLGIPTLMVGEKGVVSALDYRELFYEYTKASELVDYTEQWLNDLPLQPGTNRRLGSLDLKIELPFRSFGDYVAENEANNLENYFVRTNEFEAVYSGRAKIFVGRKGTGKTATMFQTLNELKKDKRVLTVPVKPSSYDLAALVNLLNNFADTAEREFFLKALWGYLLKTEIAISLFKYLDSLPAKSGGNPAYEELKKSLDLLRIDVESDMSTRIDDIILDVQSKDKIKDAAIALNTAWRGIHDERLRKSAKDFGRIAVLVDNLDKTWESGADFSKLSYFILALIGASNKIEQEFEKQRTNFPAVNVTLGIFVRADIYNVLKEYAREPDKINYQMVQWRDEHLLIRVLEERYVANRGGKVSAASMWTELFTEEVHGLKTRDYFLWRSLPRPRDIIFLGNSALTTAINRNHSMVTAADIEYAEKEYYSTFAIDALLVESVSQNFDLEEVFVSLISIPSTNTENELREYIQNDEEFEDIINWLIQRGLFKSRNTPTPHQLDNGPTSGKNKRIKSLQITSSHTGRTVAP